MATPPATCWGESVDGGGDVNCDGFDDFIASANEADYVRVYSGVDGSVLYEIMEPAMDTRGHETVAMAGDVNMDGHEDFIIGAARDQTAGVQAGAARVYSGMDGGLLYEFLGPADGNTLGEEVAGAGDLNTDGFDDLVVSGGGGPSEETTATVFSGIDGSIMYEFTADPIDTSFLATSVGAAGDMNGDGFPDVIVGNYRGNHNGNDSGSVYVYSGLDGSTLVHFQGKKNYAGLGLSVSGVGDLDGDGCHEVTAGAYHVYGDYPSRARVYAGHPTPLWLSEPVPGTTGVPNTITVTGAEPGMTIVIYGKFLPGVSVAPCQSGTINLGMRDTKQLASLTANGAGVADLTRPIPTAFSGRTFRFQAIEFENCRFTKHHRVQFPLIF